MTDKKQKLLMRKLTEVAAQLAETNPNAVGELYFTFMVRGAEGNSSVHAVCAGMAGKAVLEDDQRRVLSESFGEQLHRQLIADKPKSRIMHA